MTKVTIELPESQIVSMRNGASITVNPVELAKVLGAEIFAYGVGQVHRDAASGATKAAEAEGSLGVQAEAQAMMERKAAQLLAGDWTVRGEGGGTDPRVLVARSITRKAMKEALGKDSPEWAKFTGLSDADQLAKLDENYAANREILEPAVDAEIARRAEKAKTAKAVAKKVSFAI